MPEQFGPLLRRRREARGLTQKALAQRIDLSPAMVGLIESGERRAARGQILRAAAALDLPAAERDELLAAAGHLPAAYDRVPPTDPDVRLLVELLGDPALAPEGRRALRLAVRLAALRWRPDLLDLSPLAEQLDQASPPDGSPAEEE
jgi:transcriptional regulator with XRE-family HTH domain